MLVAVPKPWAPINSTGPCPLTVAGPYAAWMPRKSLQGRTCSVSRDGGRARAPAANAKPRGRGALTARGTRRESVPGGSVAASMPPHGPASGGTPRQTVCWWFCRRTKPPRLAICWLLVAVLKPRAPTNSTGPCAPTVAGPYAAWMPRKSLQGRTCSVSRDGGRARALQQTRSLECAVPSPLAGHAVNPSMEARWRHPCRHTVPQAVRTPPQTVCWWFC